MSAGGAARVANIGPRGRGRRALMGAATLTLGLLVLVALVLGGAERAWRLVLLAPFWVGALGLFQARAGT